VQAAATQCGTVLMHSLPHCDTVSDRARPCVQAAVDAMRKVLANVDMQGVVVIGEGEKDEAPMLFCGEEIGTGKGMSVDIAVDPLDGTTLVANGRNGAVAVRTHQCRLEVLLRESHGAFDDSACHASPHTLHCLWQGTSTTSTMDGHSELEICLHATSRAGDSARGARHAVRPRAVHVHGEARGGARHRPERREPRLQRRGEPARGLACAAQAYRVRTRALWVLECWRLVELATAPHAPGQVPHALRPLVLGLLMMFGSLTHLFKPCTHDASYAKDARACSDVTVIILDRPRHEALIADCRAAGARIRLISDGDVAGAIETAKPGGPVDIMLGIGGAQLRRWWRACGTCVTAMGCHLLP
jgi:Bacterial fructose-1,6-bisphosphatase, glpX-encoded